MTVLSEMEQQAQLRIKEHGRVPLKNKLKLQYHDQEPGFHYVFHTDSETYPISLQAMVDAGYTFVRYKHGQLAGTPITKSSGAVTLYLMRIPEEWYEEDQKRVHEKSIKQLKDISGVGEREYAGEHGTELGKGKPIDMKIEDTPDALKLMTGDD